MIVAVALGAVVGAAAAAAVRGRGVQGAGGREARATLLWARTAAILPACAGLAVGLAAALVVGDPVLAPLCAALAWGGDDLWRRLRSERRLLWRTREALPLLARVQQEVQAGSHPVAALAWAARTEPLPAWLAARLEATAGALGRGEGLARAAGAWAEREEVPVLRLFAHLLRLNATWGSDLSPALRRLLREADQSVAFGAEERAEHGLYELLTVVFLGLDLLVGVLALAGWPAAVPGPLTTAWGRALLVASGLTTALAVAAPASLAATSPPRLRRLGAADEARDG